MSMTYKDGARHLRGAAAVLAATLLVAAGRAEAGPLEVRAEELVGVGCSDDAWAPLSVVVESTLPERLEGTVTLRQPWGGPERARAALVVPPRGRASTVLYAGPSWCDLEVCFEGSGRSQCQESIGRRGDGMPADSADVLVIQDELDLRPALSVVDVGDDSPAYTSGSEPPRALRTALARREGLGGRFVLPDRALGYSGLAMVLVEARLLDALEPGVRRALGAWVRTGGEIALFARSADELLGSAFVAEELGGLRRGQGPGQVVYTADLQALVPLDPERPDPERLGYTGDGLEPAPYGTRRAVGLGLVHVVMIDPAATASSRADGMAAAGGIGELLAWSRRPHPLGWRDVALQPDPAAGFPGAAWADPYDGGLRTFGLDPNRTDRPPVWLYLLVVLLATTGFVLILRRWAKKREAPVSRLLAGFGLVALVSSLGLFGLGAAIRGVGARYRSFGWVETAAGSTEGVLLRRSGLLFDRPGAALLPVDPDLGAIADEGGLVRSGDGQGLEMTGRQWQTEFILEHGLVDLGGAVTVERGPSGRVVAVRNGTRHLLAAASYVDAEGRRFALGDVPSGGRVALPSAEGGEPGGSFSVTGARLPDRGDAQSRFEGAVTGRLDLGCPRRGDFRGDRCTTAFVARVAR